MNYLNSYIYAIRYVINIARFKESNIPNIEYNDEFYIGLDGKDTIVRAFYSKKYNPQSIIIFPGASPYAENHPGMIMLGNALRNVGFDVYLPRIPALKNLILEKNNIDWFAHCYQELANTKIKNNQHIMIVGLSYGGASLLKATQDSRMQFPKPLSVLSYGTYFSINTALNFFITGVIKYKNKEYKITPHEWGLIVLFYNFIDSIEVNYDTEKIKNILKDRIYDKHDDVKNALQKLESNEKKLLENILEGILDSEIKDMIGLMIKKNKELLEYISPDKWANTIYNKIFVVHGANDSMVPFTESILLHNMLPNSELLISFLYEHREMSTDKGIFFKIKEILKMIRFFSGYFRYNIKK